MDASAGDSVARCLPSRHLTVVRGACGQSACHFRCRLCEPGRLTPEPRLHFLGGRSQAHGCLFERDRPVLTTAV